MRRTPLVALVLVLAAAGPARAHERSLSHSTWEIDGPRARVVLSIGERDLTRLRLYALPAAERELALAAYLVEKLQLRAGESACTPVGAPARRAAAPGRSAFAWELGCPDADALVIESDLLDREAPGHLHFARVRQSGAPLLERILTEGRRSLALRDPESGDPVAAGGPGFLASVRIGVEHIATGYDHLAFLLALLLIAASVRQVAFIATGFTVAHSVTLALAVLGIVRPDPVAVESLIGLSIAIVAAENAWVSSGRGALLPAVAAVLLAGLGGAAAFGSGRVPPGVLLGLALFALCYFAVVARAERPAPWRAAVAFLFGLVHGFGFAGILADVELPPGRLVPTLAGFNIGVELGQLVVIVLVWPVLRRATDPSAWRIGALAGESLSAVLFGLGLFWFVTRAYA